MLKWLFHFNRLAFPALWGQMRFVRFYLYGCVMHVLWFLQTFRVDIRLQNIWSVLHFVLCATRFRQGWVMDVQRWNDERRCNRCTSLRSFEITSSSPGWSSYCVEDKWSATHRNGFLIKSLEPRAHVHIQTRCRRAFGVQYSLKWSNVARRANCVRGINYMNNYKNGVWQWRA